MCKEFHKNRKFRAIGVRFSLHFLLLSDLFSPNGAFSKDLLPKIPLESKRRKKPPLIARHHITVSNFKEMTDTRNFIYKKIHKPITRIKI